MFTKKALSAVIATSLLIVLAVGAVVGFQTWFSSYSSGIFNQAENSGDAEDLKKGINNFIDGVVYYNNPSGENLTVTQLQIGNVTCSKNQTLTEGMNKIYGCAGNYTGLTDVVVYTNKRIDSKQYFEQDLSYTPPIVCVNNSETNGFYNGNGTTENPYQICNCHQLQNMSNYLDASYELVTDVDCSISKNWNSGNGFNSVGRNSPYFSGVFNGNNFEITNLSIHYSHYPLGMFGRLENSQVRNIVLRNFNLSDGPYYDVGTLAGYMKQSNISNISIYNAFIDSGSYDAGFLSGEVENNTYISNILVENSYLEGFDNSAGIAANVYNNVTINNSRVINSYIKGGNFLGGIVANLDSSSIINSNFQNSEIFGSGKIGGIIGFGDSSSSIERSYSIGNIFNYSSWGVGSIAGRVDVVSLNQVFSRGSIFGNRGTASDYIGGLIGYFDSSTLNNSYSENFSLDGRYNVGGLVGEYRGSSSIHNSYVALGVITGNIARAVVGEFSYSGIYDSYWDNETISITDAEASPQTTSALQTPTTNSGIYANWSTSVWDFGTASEYPKLVWE